MSNKSLNAMAAKTKAKYAKRLKEQDYLNLLQKKNLAEIVSYLKNETHFKECLEGVNEKAIHRGRLEQLLRNELINELSSILRYAQSSDDRFYYIVILESEINLIVECIRSFIHDDYHYLVSKLPILIENELAFSLKDIAAVKSFDDLVTVLKGTIYYDVIYKYRTSLLSEIDFVGIEQDLNKLYYSEVLRLIEKNLKGKFLDEIKQLIYTQVELENIVKIYRLKKYFKADHETIKAMITPIYSHFNEREFAHFIENVEADQLFEELAKSHYKNYLAKSRSDYIEYETKSIGYNINRKQILFSSEPDLVLLTYMMLSKTEIQNVIDIIEGVRYGVPIEQIKKILIY